MPVKWSTLEAIRGRAAVPVTWRQHLGDDFDLFRTEFLRRLPDPAQYYPCPIPCGCLSHRVVIYGDDDIVAVCECEPWDCDNIVLKNEDVAVYELDMPSLGRAVTKAFGFRPRCTDMGIPATLEIGAYTEQGIPVILTIRHDSDALHRGVSELVARLRAKFILVVPTIDLLKARTLELLNGVGAAVLSLEATVRMNAGGGLHTVKPPEEILATVVPVQAASSEPTRRPSYVLRQGLRAWVLVFNGQETTIEHEKGLLFVDCLLKKPPEQPIHATELETHVHDVTRKQKGLTELPDPTSGAAIPLDREFRVRERHPGVDDAEADRALSRKLRELRAAAEDSALSETERNEASEELDRLQDARRHLAFHRCDNASRAFDRVRKAIRRVHANLASFLDRQGNPDPAMQAFARHLQDHLIVPSSRFSGRRDARRRAGVAGCFTYEPPAGVVWSG